MGRRKIPQEVIDYAKELYLTVDEKGRRIYSLQQIAEKCNEKCNENVTKVTIKRWAERYGWHKLLHKAIVVSACDEDKKANAVITKVVENLPADEELIEKLAQAKRTVLVNHLKMAKKLYQAVENKDPDDKRFARLCEVANQVGKAIYEMLSDIEEAKEEAEAFPARIVIREIRVEKE